MLALGVENTTRTRGSVNIAFVLRRDGKSKVAGNQSPAKMEPDCEPNATRFLCRYNQSVTKFSPCRYFSIYLLFPRADPSVPCANFRRCGALIVIKRSEGLLINPRWIFIRLSDPWPRYFYLIDEESAVGNSAGFSALFLDFLSPPFFLALFASFLLSSYLNTMILFERRAVGTKCIAIFIFKGTALSDKSCLP